MLVRALRTILNGAGEHKPGALIDLPDDEVKHLLSKKAVVIYQEESAEPEEDTTTETGTGEGDGGGSDGDVLTDEELAQIKEELEPIDGVSEVIADVLIEAGYQSLQSIAGADPEDLVKLKGIGASTSNKIIQSAQELLQD